MHRPVVDPAQGSNEFVADLSTKRTRLHEAKVMRVRGFSPADQTRLSGNEPEMDTVPMIAIQLRMARAAAGWGVRELAAKAGVTANTVTRIENGADAKQSTMDRLQRALEAAGVEFTNGDQPGVRLTKAAAAHPLKPVMASKPTDTAKAIGGKTARATEKKT
jgi:transcriptional regulator with XRE-family HTH domain